MPERAERHASADIRISRYLQSSGIYLNIALWRRKREKRLAGSALAPLP